MNWGIRCQLNKQGVQKEGILRDINLSECKSESMGVLSINSNV